MLSWILHMHLIKHSYRTRLVAGMLTSNGSPNISIINTIQMDAHVKYFRYFDPRKSVYELHMLDIHRPIEHHMLTPQIMQTGWARLPEQNILTEMLYKYSQILSEYWLMGKLTNIQCIGFEHNNYFIPLFWEKHNCLLSLLRNKTNSCT